jgi:hypothetical protein
VSQDLVFNQMRGEDGDIRGLNVNLVRISIEKLMLHPFVLFIFTVHFFPVQI